MNFYQPLDTFTYEKLKGMIQSQGLDSVDSTLSQVKQSYPNSLNHYVLMYESRSLQGASPTNPRALVVSGSKDMVFSFNGNSEQAGFHKIEVMNFNYTTSRFDFFEVDFKKKGAERFSSPNPVKCMNCHQSAWRTQMALNDPRPNWEPYNLWPGAFGSFDVHVKLGEKKKIPQRLASHPEAPGLLAKYNKEAGWLHAFETHVKPNHPRYKHLGPFNLRDILEFTKLLARMNSFRLGRIITEDQELYKALKPKLALVLTEYCNFSGVPKTPIMNSEDGTDVKTYSTHSLEAELEAMFVPLGFRTEDWSMDFLTEGAFSAGGDRFQNPHHAKTFLRLGLEKYDPQTYRVLDQPYYRLGSSLAVEKVLKRCDELKNQLKNQDFFQNEKIYKAFRSRMLSFFETQEREPLIARCISCHVDPEADGPWIPFDKKDQLAKALWEEGYPRGTLLQEIEYRLGAFAPSQDRMPKGAVPTREQIDKFLEFLRDIGK